MQRRVNVLDGRADGGPIFSVQGKTSWHGYNTQGDRRRGGIFLGFGRRCLVTGKKPAAEPRPDLVLLVD